MSLSRITVADWRRSTVITRNLLLMLFILVSNGALAQDNVGDDSTIMYPASYFTQYAPVTALDMVNRIPGMEVSGGSGGGRGGRPGGGNAGRGGRGLGSGGGGTQILINGKRTAGKNNNAQGQLVRINSEQVDYIEIIRGTGGELDVRGSTQIANIVLFEEISNTSISYEVSADLYNDDEYKPGGALAYSGKVGDLNFLFSGSAQPRYEHRVRTENSVLPDLSANDYIREHMIREQTSYTLSTNLDYEFSEKSSARFNALYSENDDPTEVDRLTVDLVGGAFDPYWEREDLPGTQSNWEIGGDYEYHFANGNRFKILAIANENDTLKTRERWDAFADGSEIKNLFLNSGNIIEEKIVRSSYTMDVFGGQNLEFGVERAQTTLNSNLKLGIAGDFGTPSVDHGGLIPVSVPNADTQVEEIRYEPFAIHNWQISPRMSLETSLLYETSTISQTGDYRTERDFNFFKPKLDYRFDITPQLQLRFLFEKVVRQLSFTDFVAVTDNEDNDSNTLAGNAGLRPDYWWNYQGTAEYRLPNDMGVISSTFYWHRHKDFLQRIDVSSTEGELRSAAGNIGSGDMAVFEVRGSVRMTPLGMPNLLITGLASARDSQVTDPFLDITRRFNNYMRGQFNLGFRHDIPRWKMNWGMNMINRIDGNTKRYEIDDIEDDYANPFVTAFAELTAFDNMIFRLDVRNVTDVDVCRDRTRYVGHIRDNILEEIEYMCSATGPVVTLKMSGNF